MKKQKLKLSLYKKYFKRAFSYFIIVGFISYFLFVAFSVFKSRVDEINYSGLEIFTNTDAQIFIDNKKQGLSSQDQSYISAKVEPGQRKIKIVKTSDPLVFFERNIIFEKGTKVSLDLTLSVTSDTTSGVMKYFIKKIENTNKIRIISSTLGSLVQVDGVKNSTGIINADGADHTVEVLKDGYLPKTLHVSLSNNETSSNGISNEDKQKYNGYDLIVEISLFQIPFE